jgi:hypothetical protein
MPQETAQQTYVLTWQTEAQVKTLVQKLVDLLKLIQLGEVEIKSVETDKDKKNILVEYCFLE